MFDPSIIALLTLFIQTAGAVVLAWIAYKQSALNKTIVTLEKNTNSIKDALVKSVGEAEKAKGILEERARAVAKLEDGK